MRRGMILVLGFLMASTAVPQSAEARPLILNMLRGITSPIGAILGGGRHAGRHHARRATASRGRPAVAAATAGAAAVTGSAVAHHDANAPASNNTALDNTATPPAQRNAALPASPETEGRGSEPPGERALAAHTQSRLGVVGPPAWPSAYEDVLGYTLWPKNYAERLRSHGIGDVLGTAFASATTLAARGRPLHTQQARADDPAKAPAASVCGSIDLTSADWPIAEIQSAVELNDNQRGALDQLKTALSDAVSAIKSSCRDDANLAPVERLRAMQNTLWGVHDAAQLIRAPLAKFYDSLTDEQKQQFAAPASQPVDPRAMSQGDMARMCGVPASADAPMRQLEQTVRPTKAQHASLDALQKKSSEMGQFLMASCLKPIAATPAERLDAAADRLTAVIFAASNVNMALNDFTSQLDDEQKARLNTLMR